MGDWQLERYRDLLRAQGIPARTYCDYLWFEYQRMVVALGPVNQCVRITEQESDDVLRQFPRALLVRWSEGIDSCSIDATDWYNIVCDRFTPIDELPSANTRSKLRRGLKRCETRRLTTQEMLQRGFDVYHAAQTRYGRGASRPLNCNDFCHQVEIDGRFPDIIEYWGCLCDGVLVAYSRNRCFGKESTDYDVIKFDPSGLKHYTSYALIHEMNSYYLQQQGVRFVNDGSRSLLHETEFQQFLIQNFGFRRTPHRLQIRYRRPVRWLMSAIYPFRRWVKSVDDRVAALLEQERIRRGGRPHGNTHESQCISEND